MPWPKGRPRGKRRFSFASLSPERRREVAIKGAKALHLKGLAHQFTEGQDSKEAGRKGGLATWRKWKISRRGAERMVSV